MGEAADRVVPAWALRVALVLFVLTWIFGPYELRSAVPIWIPFAIALGLELQFLWSAFRQPRASRLDRRPQVGDRERFGYGEDTSELLLVHDEGRELWIPYAGETDEELDELIADAREWADEEEVLPPTPQAPRPREIWAPVRRFLTGLAIFAVLGFAAWFVEARTGWNSVSGAGRATTSASCSTRTGSRSSGATGPTSRPRSATTCTGSPSTTRSTRAGPAARSPSSRTRRGTCAASGTKAPPSATRSSRASNSVGGSACPTSARGS